MNRKRHNLQGQVVGLEANKVHLENIIGKIEDELEEKERHIKEANYEIERLNNKYNKALELLSDYNLPCEYDEGKIPDNYCEENCSDDYKKCWNKYIELELKGDSSNE